MRETVLLKAHIKGTQPLLMNALSLESLKANKGKRKEQDDDPQSIAERLLYKDPNGVLSVPNNVVLGCMRSVASDYLVPGKGKKTFKKYIMAGVRIWPEWIPIEPQEWVIDTRSAKRRTGEAIILHRPKFNKWELKFDIEIIDTGIVKSSNIRDILDDAGRYAGLMAFRPYFGTFEIVSLSQNGDEIK